MDSRTLKSTPLERLKRVCAAELKKWFEEEPPGAALSRGALPPSIQEMQRLASTPRLSGQLPYEYYDEEHELYFNGDSAGFLLEVSPTVGMDLKRIKILGGLITQGLKPQTNVQLVLYADPDIHSLLDAWRDARPREDGNIYSFLADKRVDFLRSGTWSSLFKSQPFLIRNWRLFVSLTRPVDPARPDPSEIDYLKRTRSAYAGVLDSADMPHKRLGPEQFVQLMDGILNPHPAPRPRWDWNDHDVLAEQMVDRDTLLIPGRDCLSLKHRDHSVSIFPFSVRQFPLQWPGYMNGELIGALMSNVQRLPCPVIYAQTIHVTDQVSARGNAKLKAARATQMLDSPMGRFVPAWKDRKQDWDFTVASMEDGHKLLKAHWQVVAFAPEGSEDACIQRIRAIFEGLGWQLSQDRFTALHAFKSALPLMVGPTFADEIRRLGLLRSRLTWNIVNTAPVVGEWKGTGRPLLMTFGRRGQIQYVDNFANDDGNYNIAMSATSGSGKSFLTNELIVATRATGGRVSVIDAGESYKKICALLDGQYITFSREKRPCLNPFTRVNADEFHEEELPLLKQLHGQMASPEKPLESLQQAFMEQAIVASWKAYGNEANPTVVAEQLGKLGQTDSIARDLSTMLYSYTRDGSYGTYFNGKANIDLSNPFVVLELDNLVNTPDLQSVVLLSLMLSITESMYLQDRSMRKLAIIDEAWQLMGTGAAGKFIERGYRTARKYGGAFMTITQGINDYYKSPISRAALESSDFLYLLRMKAETIKQAREEKQIAMDDSLEEILHSLHKADGMYSEVAIKGPAGVSVGRLLVDPFAQKLYSTTATEVQFIRDAQAQGMSLIDALDELVRRDARRAA